MKNIVYVSIAASILTVTILMQALTARAQDLTISGELSWDGFRGSNKVEYIFSFEKHGAAYRIKLQPISGMAISDYTASSDGVDGYLLHDSWKSREAKNKGIKIDENGFVRPDIFPLDAPRPLQCIWVAFASKGYFPAETNYFGLPMEHMEYAPTNAVRTQIHYLPKSPFLSDCEAFSSNYIIVNGKTYKLPQVYSNGYLAWRMETISSTNVYGVAIPSQIEFHQYFPKVKDPQNGEDNILIHTGSLKVTNISNADLASQSLLPQAKGDVFVADYRYETNLPTASDGSKFGFVYTINNSKWRGRHAEQNKAQLASIVTSSVYVQPINTNRAYSFRIIFAGLIFISLLFVVKAVNKSRNKQSDKT